MEFLGRMENVIISVRYRRRRLVGSPFHRNEGGEAGRFTDHAGALSIYEYTPFCNGPGDVKFQPS